MSNDKEPTAMYQLANPVPGSGRGEAASAGGLMKGLLGDA